jgi:hypothetical protein
MYQAAPARPKPTNITRTRTGCDACRRRKKKVPWIVKLLRRRRILSAANSATKESRNVLLVCGLVSVATSADRALNLSMALHQPSEIAMEAGDGSSKHVTLEWGGMSLQVIEEIRAHRLYQLQWTKIASQLCKAP